MRVSVVICVVAALACATGGSSPLYGSWRSSEELTLKEVAGVPLTERQREILTAPGFFGQLVITYEPGRARSEFEGMTTYMSYKILDSGEGFIEIEHLDPLTGEELRTRLLIEDNKLRVPVENLGFHEVFTRVN